MKHFIVKSYGKKDEDVVNKNYAAVDRDGEYKERAIDPAWSKLGADAAKDFGSEPEFVTKVVRPINAQDGDLLPVSSFKEVADGTWPSGTAKFEKRGVSSFVPVWNAANCIQCNKCAYVCPHACIRPFVLDENEAKGMSAEMLEIKAPAAMKGMFFRMQVGVMDCLGCGNCVDVCPGNPKQGKALSMVPLEGQESEAANWDYCEQRQDQTASC
jgi:pyruvate-ferredoxin/flavodoxin oxidoreductase